MPENNEGLNIEMGITLNRLVRQLAQAEARMVKTAKRSEDAFKQSNARSERSFGGVSRVAQGMLGSIKLSAGQARFALQNTALQAQDIVVQLQAGTAASRVFAQQVPQIAGAFGPLGAILGVIVGLAIPAGAAILGLSNDAEALETRINALTKAVDDYRSASELANSSTGELAERFGREAEGIRPILLALSDAKLLEAEAALTGVVEQIVEIGKANDRLNDVSLANFFDLPGITGYIGLSRELKDELEDLSSALAEFENADTFGQQVESGSRVLELFRSLAAEQDGINEEEREFINLIGQAVLEAERLRDETTRTTPAIEAVKSAADEITSALEGSSGVTDTLIEKAGTLTERFAEAAGNIAEAIGRAAQIAEIEKLGVSSGRGTVLPDNVDRQFASQGLGAPPVVPEKSSSGGRGGGRGRAASINAEADATKKLAEARQAIIDQGQQQIERLTLEGQMLGKSAEEAVRLRTEYELLNAAKQQGIDVDTAATASGQSLRQVIEDQSAAIARMTTQQEFANQRAQYFESLQAQLSDAAVDAIIGYGNLSDAIANLASQLAKAALQALLLGTGPLGGLSGGVGLLSGIGFAEGGYTGDGGKYQPKGVVHGGEYVFSKEATQRIGVANLDAMHRRLKGFASGGHVGGNASAAQIPPIIINNRTVIGDDQFEEFLERPAGDRAIRKKVWRETRGFSHA